MGQALDAAEAEGQRGRCTWIHQTPHKGLKVTAGNASVGSVSLSNLSKAVREKAGLPPKRSRSAADGLGLELLQGLFLVLHPDQTYQPPAQDLLPKVQQPWWTDSYRYNL